MSKTAPHVSCVSLLACVFSCCAFVRVFWQRFLGFKSRKAFLKILNRKPRFTGDLIENKGLYKALITNFTRGRANRVTYPFLNGKTTYYGGMRQGFALSGVKISVGSRRAPIKFSLTFATQFDLSAPLFDSWMTNRRITGGQTVTDGGLPFDTIVIANQYHALTGYDTIQQYTKALTQQFIPRVRRVAKSPRSLIMFGSLSTVETRKMRDVYQTANPRQVAFDITAQRALDGLNFGSFVQVYPVTAARPDLTFEGIHYVWPVTLTLLDLWLGSTCSAYSQAL